MKKSIIMTIIMVMIISLASLVNAANATATVSMAGSKVVKTDDEITVTMTVNSKETVVGADFTVKYDPAFLKYVKSSAVAANGTEAGKIVVEHFATEGIKTITFTFKVIGKEGSSKITATPTTFTSGSTEEDEIKVDSIEGPFVVSIAKKAETQTTAPTKPATQDETPKTGSVNVAPIVAVAALVSIVISAVVAKRMIKK